MGEPALLVEDHDRVRMLLLNRPERFNAIDEELLTALAEAIDGVGRGSRTEAIVLTGVGRAFCAGGDVGTLTRWQGLPAQERRSHFDRAADLARRLSELPVPVVCAVNGATAGAGLDVALAADVCLAARSATFQSGFVAMGLVPDMGGAWLLPRVVGLSRARLLLLGGERLDATTASSWGMVADVVDDDELVPIAVREAARLAAQPRPAFLAARRALLDTRTFGDALDNAAMTQSLLMDTPEHRERAERFRARAG